jgi:hypothetical protein
VTLVPPAVVTVTSTVPVPTGLVAVIVLLPTTRTLLASARPKWTVAGLLKPVPVIVTLVPATAGPADGEMALTVGCDESASAVLPVARGLGDSSEHEESDTAMSVAFRTRGEMAVRMRFVSR